MSRCLYRVCAHRDNSQRHLMPLENAIDCELRLAAREAIEP
jgi:hypothetical protein